MFCEASCQRVFLRVFAARVSSLCAVMLLGACAGPAVTPSPGETILGSPPPQTSVSDNAVPTITGTPASSITVGADYRFVPEAVDADGDALVFTIENAPDWIAFDRDTGEISGTPDANNVGTYANILISVSDGHAESSLPAFSIEVQGAAPATPPASTPTSPATPTSPISPTFPTTPTSPMSPLQNHAPMLSGTPGSSVVKGDSYSFQPTASDADGDTLVFSIKNKPAWASFSSSTGRLSGSTASASVGSYGGIVISVSDRVQSVSLPAFSIAVEAPANAAPTIEGNPATSVAAGAQYSFQPKASDANRDKLSFSIRNKPAWASFDAATGRLSGTPGASNVGEYDGIVISVSDGQASASLPAFSISVTRPPNSAPVISGTPPTSVLVGASYGFTPSVSDANKDKVTFTIKNKPGWASFSASTGTLSGVPTAGDIGHFGDIVIGASDGQAQDSLPAFAIDVVRANAAPVLTGTPATTVMAGSAYTFQPTATDADGDTLRFSIKNKPSWASFNTSSGRLSGTPQANQAGRYAGIVISVSDGQVSVSLPAFTITVQAASTGTAELHWVPPTQNTNGTPLTDLSGFHVYYGRSAGGLDQVVSIQDPAATSYTVRGLESGTWFFAVRAVDSSGTESAPSNSASKDIG